MEEGKENEAWSVPKPFNNPTLKVCLQTKEK